MSLSDWHNKFGGTKWRLTSLGIEVWEKGFPRSHGVPTSVISLWEDFGEHIHYVSSELGVPADMIIAMIPIEAVRLPNGRYNPKSLRLEPGYASDEGTPHKVSPGLMQTLISTARGMALKYNLVPPNVVDRDMLFKPHYSILLGGAYIARQIEKYGPDPVLVCAAYNAGSVRKTSSNTWHMVAYGDTRMDRYVMWFNDFHAAVREGLIVLPSGIPLSTDNI